LVVRRCTNESSSAGRRRLSVGLAGGFAIATTRARAERLASFEARVRPGALAVAAVEPAAALG
jgi:hypothetical protein